MKLNKLLVILLFVAGFAGIIVFRLSQRIIPEVNEPDITPTQLPSRLDPPTSALTAELSDYGGVPKKKSRDGKDITPVAAHEGILQGESIITDATSSANVALGNNVSLSIGPDTVIGFSNLLPDMLLLNQTAGNINYVNLRQDPLSVRSQMVLTELKNGIMRIEVSQDDVIKINLSQGIAKIAVVDTENQTHIYDLTSGELFTITTADRYVVIK